MQVDNDKSRVDAFESSRITSVQAAVSSVWNNPQKLSTVIISEGYRGWEMIRICSLWHTSLVLVV